ncbi:MAG TPA: sporulation phosphorelay system protein KapB [Bacillales bacterium]|nr:sporulation phosphorelay system protein KapB [Bacillales bacterium]
MTEKPLSPGEIVTATYKTGKYIAELVEQGNDKTLVKIVAVLRHPTQGDLHSPGRVDVAFQQRRALAFNEKTWVHPASVKQYEKDVPDYKESLREALDAEIAKLKQKDDAWSERSIEQLEDLKKDYKLI